MLSALNCLTFERSEIVYDREREMIISMSVL